MKYSVTTSALMSGAAHSTVRVEGPDASTTRLVGGPDGSACGQQKMEKKAEHYIQCIHVHVYTLHWTCIHVHKISKTKPHMYMYMLMIDAKKRKNEASRSYKQ